MIDVGKAYDLNGRCRFWKPCGKGASMSMSYEGGLQMHFVQIGLDEGIRRGEELAFGKIARRMNSLGISIHAIATCLDIKEDSVRKFIYYNDTVQNFVELPL